jgi:hypothetical protein
VIEMNVAGTKPLRWHASQSLAGAVWRLLRELLAPAGLVRWSAGMTCSLADTRTNRTELCIGAAYPQTT